MTLTPPSRKALLTLHLVASVGWIGTVVAYLALGVAAATSDDPATVRGAWAAMELTGWFVIVPFAVGALLSGVLLALGTPWGLVRHYWVLISLALTLVCVVILLLHMPDVSAQAAVARTAPSEELQLLGGDLLHPALGLVLLLVTTVLNVYKPSGLTPYGWRKQQEETISRVRARTDPASVDRRS